MNKSNPTPQQKTRFQFGLSSLIIITMIVAVFFGGRISMRSKINELQQTVKKLEAKYAEAAIAEAILNTPPYKPSRFINPLDFRVIEPTDSIEKGLKLNELESKSKLLHELRIDRTVN